ncbi:MAG TPA: hypothetical protein VHG72_21815 [Polyangia bacterium]|nr:hypothetical protein [Polyangia bacterium]
MSLESLPGFPGTGTFRLPAEEARPFTVHEFAKPQLDKVESALASRKPRASNTSWVTAVHAGECPGEPSFDRPWCNDMAHWKLGTDSADGWLLKERDTLRALVAAPDRPLGVDDLKWAAIARCVCRAGLAYPKFIGDPHGHWICSAVLLGSGAPDSEHDKPKPFAFWSIKSDDQPSANGATTRPTLPYPPGMGEESRRLHREYNRLVAAQAAGAKNGPDIVRLTDECAAKGIILVPGGESL